MLEIQRTTLHRTAVRRLAILSPFLFFVAVPVHCEPEFPDTEAWQGVAGVRLGVTAQAEHPIAAAMHQCTRRAPARGQVAGHTLVYTASRIHPPAPRHLANDAFSYKWSF